MYVRFCRFYVYFQHGMICEGLKLLSLEFFPVKTIFFYIFKHDTHSDYPFTTFMVVLTFKHGHIIFAFLRQHNNYHEKPP